MDLSWDEAKRQRSFQERGLDFADAIQVFDDVSFTFPDQRKDYGEDRFITVGFLMGRMVVLVHTPRGTKPHIISMRKANECEQRRFKERLDRS